MILNERQESDETPIGDAFASSSDVKKYFDKATDYRKIRPSDYRFLYTTVGILLDLFSHHL